MAEIPTSLRRLATGIQGKNYQSAKRIIVSQVGSVQPREHFDDDVADAVFLRLQNVAQVGAYSSEKIIQGLGRAARRLQGPGSITLYRSAPAGAGIRPGDFCSDSKHEVGFYRHGGNRVQMRTVPKEDVIQVAGSSGGNQEYVYLPKDYVAPKPVEYFTSFRQFYQAVNTNSQAP